MAKEGGKYSGKKEKKPLSHDDGLSAWPMVVAINRLVVASNPVHFLDYAQLSHRLWVKKGILQKEKRRLSAFFLEWNYLSGARTSLSHSVFFRSCSSRAASFLYSSSSFSSLPMSSKIFTWTSFIIE